MDSITFELGDVTVQLVNGEILFWNGIPNHEPDLVLEIDRLQDVLSTARMLRKYP